MTNTLTAAGGILLLAMTAMAPVSFAHWDSGAHDIAAATAMPYATTGLVLDPYTLCAPPTSATCNVDPNFGTSNPASAGNADRVSGWYYGSPSLYVQLNETGVLDGVLSAGAMFCDMEVLLGDETDESVVDGVSTTGLIGDGLFNDGGFGGACHVGNGGYNGNGYDANGDPQDDGDYRTTPGCNYGNALAEDAVSGSEIWISTTCDWLTPIPDPADPSTEDILVTGVLCAVNEVLEPGDFDPLPCANYVLDCLGVGTSGTCPDGVGGFACGHDSSADAAEFGEGDGASTADDFAEHHAPTDLAATAGVPFPQPTGLPACNFLEEVAGVFVYSSLAIHVNGGAGHNGPASIVENVGVATYGWIA